VRLVLKLDIGRNLDQKLRKDRMYTMDITPGPCSGGGKNCDYPASFYAATVEPELPRPALQGVGEVAYAVIGGGYAGLGAALRLAGAGESVALLEACRLGWGASGRNGGQAHIGWNKDQLWLEQTFGLGFARQMWQVAMDARNHLDGLLALDPDGCDYLPGVLHANHRARLDQATRDHAHYMADFYQHPLRYVPPDELRSMLGAQGYSGGLFDPQGGHLHPLKLALAMARAAEARARACNSPALSIRPERGGWRVETPQGCCMPTSCCWPPAPMGAGWRAGWMGMCCRWATILPPPRRWTRIWHAA
jgi:gamma-glutamylputrescine oxidase